MMPEKLLTVTTVLLSTGLDFSVQDLLSLLEQKNIDPSEYKNIEIGSRGSWDSDYDIEDGGFAVVHHRQVENPNFEAEMETFNRENQEDLQKEADRKKEGRIQEDAVLARKAYKELQRQKRISEKILGRHV